MALDSANSAATHAYDGEARRARVKAASAERSSKQGVLDCPLVLGGLNRNYDDPRNLARFLAPG